MVLPVATSVGPGLVEVAELFAVLSTPVRLQIVQALCGGEQSVSQLSNRVSASRPNVSRHLQVLHQAGILARHRVRQQIFYRIADENVVQLCEVACQSAAAHPGAQEQGRTTAEHRLVDRIL